MKKYFLMLALLSVGVSAFAQKSRIRDARSYLSDNDYKKAITAIDEAVANESTKDNADAWFLRGVAYLQKALDTTVNDPQASVESYNSLMKALAIKPDYGTEINNAIYSNALIVFNKGVEDYGKKDYNAAYDQFMKVPAIFDAGGNRFANDKGFMGLATSAKSNAAYSALNAKRDADALKLFNELIAGPSKNDSGMYQAVIELCQRMGNETAALEAINKARAQFPTNQVFRNLELNYYIKAGKEDVLVAKLEEAVKADPNNDELLFNLGNAYQNMAFPKDASGKDLPQPANYDALFAKAEDYYKRAVAAKPSNADYDYNLGVLYYSVAVDRNRKMNALSMSAADQAKYDALLKDRDGWFDKALKPFEAAYAILDAKSQSGQKMNMDEKVTYQKTMIGLREIYARKNNKAKTDELKKKLDALH